MMLVFHIDVVLSFIRKNARILSKHGCLSLLIIMFLSAACCSVFGILQVTCMIHFLDK